MTVWDVVVVGAGPSGALAAREVARKGASVLLLDRAVFPRWKVCGACLSPGARRVLEGVGLDGLPAELGGVPLERLALHAGGGSATVALRGSMALSRSVFDAALARAAESEGATFWPRVRASLGGAPEGGLRTLRLARAQGTTEVRTRVVVDATGLGHGLRLHTPGRAHAERGAAERVAEERAAHGAPPVAARPATHVEEDSRVGLGAVLRGEGYPVEPGVLHMAVGRSGYVGLVRLEDGRLNVGAALDPAGLGLAPPGEAVSAVLEEAGFPPLREQPLDGWRGTPPLTRTSANVGGERLFRIGDAAGYVEPFTGEGICWGLSAGCVVAGLAVVAAERWREEALEQWRTYRARSLRPAQRLCRTLARGLRKPWLVRAAIGALQIAPGLATPLVARAGRPPLEVGA